MTRVNPKYPSPIYFPTTADEGQRTQRSEVRQPSTYLGPLRLTIRIQTKGILQAC